jgi:hypothetical protein
MFAVDQSHIRSKSIISIVDFLSLITRHSSFDPSFSLSVPD